MLTTPQRAMLKHVGRCMDDYDGYAPHGAAEWRTIRVLEKNGLVEFLAMGECGDGCERAGDCPHPVSIYRLTDDGHKAWDADNYDGPKDGESWSGGFAENH